MGRPSFVPCFAVRSCPGLHAGAPAPLEPSLKSVLSASIVVAQLVPLGAHASGHTVPMVDKGASTYYVDVAVRGAGTREFLVDTGSSYSTMERRR